MGSKVNTPSSAMQYQCARGPAGCRQGLCCPRNEGTGSMQIHAFQTLGCRAVPAFTVVRSEQQNIIMSSLSIHCTDPVIKCNTVRHLCDVAMAAAITYRGLRVPPEMPVVSSKVLARFHFIRWHCDRSTNMSDCVNYEIRTLFAKITDNFQQRKLISRLLETGEE